MNVFNHKLYNAFSNKNVLKVIAGLDNTNIYNILKLAKISELAGATYLDIVAKPSIVSILKSVVKLPICVSSISSLELYNCALAGADILEIGNYDVFYEKKLNLNYSDIVNLAYQTRKLIKDKDICVTIPNSLNLLEQLNLAKDLEEIGINIIQTEGSISKANISLRKMLNHDFIRSSTSSTSCTLSSTYVISKNIDIPVIAASGINSISSPIGIFYGASGIGVGSSIKDYMNTEYLLEYIQEIIFNMKQYNNQIKLSPLVYKDTSLLDKKNITHIQF